MPTYDYNNDWAWNDDLFQSGSPSAQDTNFKWPWEEDATTTNNQNQNQQPNNNQLFGNDPNYTGDPSDPYTFNTENTYNGSTQNPNNQNLTIPVNNDPNVVGSSTYDPTGGIPLSSYGIPTNINDGINQGGGMPGGSGGGGFGLPGSNSGAIIPIPGINWPTAIGTSILLSNGNIFGGGGSISNLPSTIGNIASDPIGSVNSSLSNLGNSIMGPNGLGQVAAGGVIAWPSGGGGGGGSGGSGGGVIGPAGVSGQSTPPTIAWPTGTGSNSTVEQNNPTTLTWPAHTPGPISTTVPGQLNTSTGTDNSIFGGSGGSTTILPGGGLGNGQPGGGAGIITTPTQSDSGTASHPTTSIIPIEHQIPANTTPTSIIPTGTTTPTETHNPTGTTITPTGTTPTPTNPTNVVIPPIVPTNNTTMPTPSLPTPRSYFGEGNQSTQDLGALWQQIAGLYGNTSGAYANTDYSNYNNIANQFGSSNNNLTGIANGQTAAANTSLRTGNLNDVQNLYGQAMGIRNAANPNLYGQNGALNTYTQGAQGNLQWAQNQLNNAGSLTPEDVRNSQQAAREAWSARGLVNSPGAVGEEILNRSNLTQQRQQQAFNNVNTGLAGMQGATSAQSQNIFDPFGTILGAQYGQQTNNAGSNNNLFGQAASFGSGQQGNQFVQNAFNPYNNYSQDVYSSNNNAANAQYISGQNNAAALQGANTAANSQILGNFLGSLAGLYGSGVFGSCWVAREVYGVNDPKWLLFRHWLLTEAPAWFRNAYLKHGEQFAAWLKRHPQLKPAIRTFMDSKINQTFTFKEDFSHAL